MSEEDQGMTSIGRFLKCNIKMILLIRREHISKQYQGMAEVVCARETLSTCFVFSECKLEAEHGPELLDVKGFEVKSW